MSLPYHNISDSDMMDDLRRPSPPSLNPNSAGYRKSNAKAVLSIHIDSMKKEELDKVIAALELLRQAGILFDTGMGMGNIDWVFNENLEGAHLRVYK